MKMEKLSLEEKLNLWERIGRAVQRSSPRYLTAWAIICPNAKYSGVTGVNVGDVHLDVQFEEGCAVVSDEDTAEQLIREYGYDAIHLPAEVLQRLRREELPPPPEKKKADDYWERLIGGPSVLGG